MGMKQKGFMANWRIKKRIIAALSSVGIMFSIVCAVVFYTISKFNGRVLALATITGTTDPAIASIVNDTHSAYLKLYYLGIPIIVITVSLIIISIISLNKRISRPILSLRDAAEKIADGNLQVNLAELESGDEIGELVASFQRMQLGLEEQAKAVQIFASGDLTVKSVPRSEDDILAHALNKAIESLGSLVGQINLSADQVSVGSSQVAGGSQALAAGAAEQASSIEALSQAVNKVAQQAEDNANRVRRGNKYVLQASEGVEQSNAEMIRLSDAMQDMEEVSEQITSIIGMIEDIAFQTNILSLNAAVEAARAGVAGKGFAVVADEVRNLATKSAEAAQKTSELIHRSRERVKAGKLIASDVAAVLETVKGRAGKVHVVIEEIEEASVEQTQAIADITQGIDQISSVVQTNAATAEESSASSEELSAQAAQLKEMIGKLRISSRGTPVANASSRAARATPVSFAFTASTAKY